jgi:hypothetical protein
VAVWPADVPVLPAADGLWLPCEPPPVPDCDDEAGAPPGLEEDELEDDPLLLDGEEVGEGVPPADPDEPELGLDGVLGTGMPLGLGWVMALSGRHPDNNSAPQTHATAVTRTA